MEISLPGEQVQPLPKMANKNRKNNQKSKPNGFIYFANAQKKLLGSQYNIRGPQMLVELCDPLWRKLTPDEKKEWTQKAKEEHARSMGRKTGDPALRMDCNRKYISERQEAEKAESQRRDRERKFVKEELERCEEVTDAEFYIIDALSIVEYMDGEHVPCEIAVVKCSVRGGILGYYHFFPDPGPLRAGHFAEALERCELEHEIKPKDFPLASKDYEGDVSRLVELMNLRSPKHPLIFSRSSEAKKTESCLEWLGFRVDQEFKPKVMELECFIEELVAFTKNTPPSFAQIRRLLFETKFDFMHGNRCDFHSQTDKMACSIGNVRKYVYFMSEILYDYYEFDIVEGHHFPVGYDNSCAVSRASLSATSSVLGDFDDVSSVASSFSVGSYQQNRNIEPPRRPNSDFSLSSHKKNGDNTPELLSQLSMSSQPNSFTGSVNSFNTAATHISSVGLVPANSFNMSTLRTPDVSYHTALNSSLTPSPDTPRRPNLSTRDLTYDKVNCQNDTDTPSSDVLIKSAYVSGVNSFCGSTSTRTVSPVSSIGRGNQPSQPPYPQQSHKLSEESYKLSQEFNQMSDKYRVKKPQPYQPPLPQSHHSNPSLAARTVSTVPSVGRSRGRGVLSASSQSSSLAGDSLQGTLLPGPSIGRGRGRGTTSIPSAVAPMPRRPNNDNSKKSGDK